MNWPEAAAHAWELLITGISGPIKAVVITALGVIGMLSLPRLRSWLVGALTPPSGPTLAEVEAAAAKGVKSALNGVLGHIRSDITRLTAEVTGLSADIKDLRSDIGRQGDDLSEQGERIATIEGRLSVERRS